MDLIIIGKTNSGINLIYDDDSPFGPITWLDCTSNIAADWQTQEAWARNIGNGLVVSLDDGYATTNDWTSEWRLPLTKDGVFEEGYDGTTTAGLNIINSEMGHLFYKKLGYKGPKDINGNEQVDYGWKNSLIFNNLKYYTYWSGTKYAGVDAAWLFDMAYGNQFIENKSLPAFALAVRPGQVTSRPCAPVITKISCS